MTSSKIVDRQEVLQWFEEGWTYREMRQEYIDKYNIVTSMAMWPEFRRREGLPRRINRDDSLIPWEMREEHRNRREVQMLRAEGRRRAGMPLREKDQRDLPGWLDMLKREKRVVHYDPDTEQGFFLIPREKQDDDIIRRPKRVTTKRKRAD